ncbi:hypothetical protein [Echinicola sp. 20G]|uniref:hypothetical protein n=1 Tax=Echinicola sp. 20G TaxID=2781961 RepID=UPI0019101993|nr:hypothetical protein [Echinicola sp. 20G]
MKKLIKNLLIIFISFAVVDFTIGYVLKNILRNSPDGRFYKTKYSLESSDEQIVIYGSSRAEGNFVPKVFEEQLGLSCWNAGRGGQSLPYMYAVNQGVVTRHAPKIAIINIESMFLEYEPGNPFFDRAAGLLRPFYQDHDEIHKVINQVSPAEKYLNYSNFYSFNSSYYYLLRPFAFKGIDGKVEDKGWKPKIGSIKPNAYKANVVNETNQMDTTLTKLFDEFVSSLVQKNTQVFVVISPDYNEKVISTSTLNYVRKMKNIILLDHSNDEFFTKNNAFYKDQNHLNKEGAMEFSNEIAKEIEHHLNSTSTNSHNSLVEVSTL